jgi:hypothetical protein
MPAWALRAVAVLITGLSMLGSTTYALAHPKNPNAPLQPPVAEKPTPAEPEPDPTEAPAPFRTLAPTVPPTPSPSPSPTAKPTATLAGVQARATATPTAAPRTAAPTLRPTPVPQITLAAGVRATSLPKVTYTHSS